MKNITALVVVLFAMSAQCNDRVDDATLTRYVKTIDVAVLDKSLESEELEKWLRSGPAKITKVEYLPGNCDLKPTREEPKGGWPLCVKLILRRGQLNGHAVIKVGTVRRGIQGEPSMVYMEFSSDKLSLRGVFKEVGRLSDLPRVLAELDSADKQARDRSRGAE